MKLLNRIFIDSGIWIALLNKKDPDHLPVVEALRELKKEPFKLYTSDFVISEIATYLRYNAPISVLVKFTKNITTLNRSGLTIFYINEKLLFGGLKEIEKFTELKLSLTDVTASLLVKKEKLDLIFTLDAHFSALNINAVPIKFKS